MSKEVKELIKDRAQNSETVKVVVRCRPLSSKEMQAVHEVCVNMKPKTGEIFLSKPASDEPPK